MGERDGVLVVDKASGPTSHDVVAGVRRIFSMRRVGHCGTLDPLATGVLVVCLGAYTRLSDWLSKGDKEYESVFFLGARSDTGDRQGQIQVAAVQDHPGPAAVSSALQQFTGLIQQVPPAYSAIKVDGVRSYRLARRQQPVALDARQVEVKAIEVLAYRPPRLRLRILCSRGTYIRSLAMDLGEALGCGAYVEDLRRLRVGKLDLDRAYTLDQLQVLGSEDRLGEVLVPVPQALSQLPACELSPGQIQVFAHGGSLRPAGIWSRQGECAVYGAQGRLLGIGSWAEGELRPLKVFVSQSPLAEVGSGH
ncbi:MAG: tRNA pseudouridine(55) synthase TruB [Candidatus Latescibacteria bacterium]|nr:tRNA pseudouridine(55) synthase TruB [Candidatus Latescibacterota bacterium]